MEETCLGMNSRCEPAVVLGCFVCTCTPTHTTCYIIQCACSLQGTARKVNSFHSRAKLLILQKTSTFSLISFAIEFYRNIKWNSWKWSENVYGFFLYWKKHKQPTFIVIETGDYFFLNYYYFLFYPEFSSDFCIPYYIID